VLQLSGTGNTDNNLATQYRNENRAIIFFVVSQTSADPDPDQGFSSNKKFNFNIYASEAHKKPKMSVCEKSV
jgi:hypothetical protein